MSPWKSANSCPVHSDIADFINTSYLQASRALTDAFQEALFGIRAAASVTYLALGERGIVNLPMTHFPQAHAQKRAPRIQLGGSIAALVMLEDGQRAKGKLQTLSVTGGLLRLAKSLAQGDFVEVAFQTQSGDVRGMAEMLNPVRGPEGTLQPFRFIALGDDDHRTLRQTVDSASDRSFLGMRSSQWAPISGS